jgi:hypothetical protein
MTFETYHPPDPGYSQGFSRAALAPGTCLGRSRWMVRAPWRHLATL